MNTIAEDYPVMSTAVKPPNRLRPDLCAEMVRALIELEALRKALIETDRDLLRALEAMP